ncbi:hypothetical protein BGX28_004838 [Mortierella sp. GBA30]|nr:hypothetical protein BGX28_004838 [Mortierella sp. GBA30]
MSKRGTENQMTKDDYEREEDDDSSIQIGVFKKASQDELARRPMKALRRTKSSVNSSDDGSKKPSPFAAMGAFSTPSSQPLAEPSPKPNPFSNLSFGQTAGPFSTSQPAFSSGAIEQKPAFPSTAAPPEASPAPEAAATAPSTAPVPVSTNAPLTAAPALTTSFPAVPSSSFGKGAFTFNVGSKASAISMPSTANDTSTDESRNKIDREGYERSIRGVNQSFLKKIMKELDHNPIVNLAQIFNQYIDHRNKVRKAFLGTDEPNKRRDVSGDNRSTSGSESGPGIRMTSIAGVPVESASGPKLSFGLPLSEIGENPPAKSSFPGFGLPTTATTTAISASSSAPIFASTTTSAATTSGSTVAPVTPSASLVSSNPFSFGSSSIKGAVDPPKNPISTGWTFGTPSLTPSNSFTTSSSAPTTSTFSTTTAPSTINPFATVASKSISGDPATTPKPFMFNPTPFAFTPTKTAADASSSSAPKPFAFQVPSGASSPHSDAGSSSANQGDHEKMPDDTKAQLVDTREGEEGEETVFEVRAKLYAATGSEYKDLGVGPFRVNENVETKKRRMIMRTGGTGQIALNSWVIQGMGPKREKNVVTLFAIEGDKPKRFMVRVKEEASAEELFKALEAGQTKS